MCSLTWEGAAVSIYVFFLSQLNYKIREVLQTSFGCNHNEKYISQSEQVPAHN